MATAPASVGVMPSIKSLFFALDRRDKHKGDKFQKAPREGDLFTVTTEKVDGDECLQDCATCTIKYPRKFDVEEDDKLYGFIKGWSTHLIVATGKSDWVRDVADEKGSIMEAVDKGAVKPSNGRMMLSASNMPTDGATPESPSTVLLLPAFSLIENVTPSTVPDLITHFVDTGPTNTTPLNQVLKPILPPESPMKARSCPHDYLILLCSQKTRDARCGQSAPLLRREFERHLRPLGLYRDLHDERPGGVGIYFISHVGGHKYSANVMIYRRAGKEPETVQERRASVVNGATREANGHHNDTESTNEDKVVAEGTREASQCIWLARVRPEDCENIVRYTILQGKVVKPERQLRGGFDRGRQLTSW